LTTLTKEEEMRQALKDTARLGSLLDTSRLLSRGLLVNGDVTATIGSGQIRIFCGDCNPIVLVFGGKIKSFLQARVLTKHYGKQLQVTSVTLRPAFLGSKLELCKRS
jgi:hypothetical protein